MTDLAIFEIPSWNVENLKDELKKLNKRADKLGCGHLRLVEHGSKEYIHPEYLQAVELGVMTREQAPKVIYYKYSIEGDAPKLAGWEFLGTLDHNTIPGQVVVNTVPGQSIPPKFYESEALCEHCNTIRYRTETFVMQHESGDYKQVGRQCIKDFLGHSPNQILQLMSRIRKLVGEIEDGEQEKFYGGFVGEYFYDNVEVLKVTAAVIRTYGWTPRLKQDGLNNATANIVEELFLPAMNADVARAKKLLKEEISWDAEQDAKDAKAAMEWLKTQDASNEYMHNLKIVAENPHGVPYKMFGYWCSLMSAYYKAVAKEYKTSIQKRISEWYGKVKDKVEVNIKVEDIISFDGYYGATRIHKMIDTDGHAFTWFSTGHSKMRRGGEYRIKGTVKKHDDYKGWKQTVLTRVSVLKAIKEA